MTPDNGSWEIRNRHHFLADAVVLFAATLVAYWLRFEGATAWAYLRLDLAYLVLSVPLRLVVFWRGGLYRMLWRYAGTHELWRLTVIGLSAAGVNLLLGLVLLPAIGLVDARVPLTILALDTCATIGGPAITRLFERRMEVRRRIKQEPLAHERRSRRVLIAGAGAAGRLIADEIKRNPATGMMVIGFLDDDSSKLGQFLGGIRIFDLAKLAEVATHTRATDLIIAMPTTPGNVVRQLAADARSARLETQTLPPLYELVSGRVGLTALRKLRIEDLLRREPIETDYAKVDQNIRGKRVLVTGAGGSIGRELCRQIAGFAPEMIGLLGHGENSIFEAQCELSRLYPAVPTRALIADVREPERLATVFGSFKPDLVFHAAAHKHVTLMEQNPVEAITNNVLGTKNVIEAAADAGVRRLVMISTDKAVRPTSIMGASKRVAEQLVQSIARERDLNFVAVRFGNVLGSRGSVVPTFLQQISDGGPLTLTDPEVRRFFMTIPEAVQLVLQAAVLGTGGEIFALDMGEAVRIVDLAHDLIRLSGLDPDRDIEIRFTGLRPGEKLYEEVFFEGASVHPTKHPKVVWTETAAVPSDLYTVVHRMEQAARQGGEESALRAMLQRLVPDFQPYRSPAPARAPEEAVNLPAAVYGPAQPASAYHHIAVPISANAPQQA